MLSGLSDGWLILAASAQGCGLPISMRSVKLFVFDKRMINNYLINVHCRLPPETSL